MKLEFRELGKAYDQAEVLKHLNATIKDAHCVACVGPSGGGKSTLLRILGGLTLPDAGEAYLNGLKIPDSEYERIGYRRRLGIVFQAYNLFPHLTALRNITLPLVKVQGRHEADAKEMAIGLLQQFGLGKHIQKMPAQLSGGQQQRVAIIRALATRPDLLLLDEPTSALDPVIANEVLHMVKYIRDQQRDIFLVTHQLSFARGIADYVLFLDNGSLIEHGPTEQVLQHPRTDIVRNFLEQSTQFS